MSKKIYGKLICVVIQTEITHGNIDWLRRMVYVEIHESYNIIENNIQNMDITVLMNFKGIVSNTIYYMGCSISH